MSSIVEDVADGRLEVPAERRAELSRDGWQRRFVAAPPRLEEAVELYRALGLEVHLEPLLPSELDPRCAGCSLALYVFRAVYTRRPG